MRNVFFPRTGLFVASVGLGFVLFSSQASAYMVTTYSSSGATQDAVILEATNQVSGLIDDRITENSGGTTGGGNQGSLQGAAGVAAGDMALTKNLWFNVAVTDVEDDHVGANYDGPIYTALIGYDRKFGEKLILGVAAGYERIDIDTHYNSGTIKSDAWTIAPYASYQINEMFSLSGSAGYTWASYDFAHTVSAVGSTDGKRMFGSLNLIGKQSAGQWRLTETLGYLYVTETQDAYTETGVGALTVAESTRHLGQIRIGGRAGYEFDTNFGYIEPYVSGRAEFDVSKSSPVLLGGTTTVGQDDNGARFGAGVKAGIGETTTLEVGVTTTAFRDDYEARMVTATLSLQF